MANNKGKDKEAPRTEIDPVDELSQLRSIVFGAAEQKWIEEIARLRGDMDQSISALDTRLTNKITEFQQNIEIQFGKIDKRLSFIDKSHDDNEANMQKSLDNLYSEHEMFASATQQDLKEVNQLLENESTSLTSNFDQQLKQLKSHLEEVSKELTSTKTDRKTLAKLLATMATNLEDDLL